MPRSSNAATVVLSAQECQDLLRTQHIGRLGVILDQYPQIFPVNFALDQGEVIVRSKGGTELSKAVQGKVAFQVDEFNYANRTGWSVLILGVADQITAELDPEALRRAEAANPRPWVPGQEFRWVRITPQTISGRRITVSPTLDDWQLGTAAYM